MARGIIRALLLVVGRRTGVGMMGVKVVREIGQMQATIAAPKGCDCQQKMRHELGQALESRRVRAGLGLACLITMAGTIITRGVARPAAGDRPAASMCVVFADDGYDC